MKCREITEALEKLSPVEYACSWDNVGLMVGSFNQEVTNILVTLEADDAAVDTAIELGADMIVTHHPFIFGKIGSITDDSLEGRRAIKMIKNGICCYSIHTNFDIKGGMAQLAADRIGMKNPQVLEETFNGEGLGRIADFNKCSINDWCTKIKDIFGLQGVVVYGDLDREVSRVAIAPGSGKDSISYAVEKGAELIITGDIGHHAGIDAVAQNLAVIDAGHYGIEHIFIEYIQKYLSGKFTDIQVNSMPKKIPYTFV